MYLSLIIGLLLGLIIGRQQNTIVHGPDSKVIQSLTINKNGKCFRYKAIPYICPL
jgi:hypothetical protein